MLHRTYRHRSIKHSNMVSTYVSAFVGFLSKIVASLHGYRKIKLKYLGLYFNVTDWLEEKWRYFIRLIQYGPEFTKPHRSVKEHK